MALVSCPECGKQVSSSSAQCIGCGHPMMATTAPNVQPLQALRYEQANAAGVICPRCGSEDTRRLSLVHAEGMTSISGSVSTTGIGASSGGVGIGVSSSDVKGSQQSALSKLVAPPGAKTAGGGRVGAMILSWFVLMVIQVTVLNIPALIAWLIASVAAIAVYKVVPESDDERWNRVQLPKERSIWERKFLCRRCGEVFEMAKPGAEIGRRG
jgi:hypothetical protein